MSDPGALGPAVLRPIEGSDLPAVLALNNDWVPEVSELDAERLEHILGESSLALVASDPEGGELLGVVIVMGPGADYDSPNYRFFADAFAADGAAGDFRYVDRIIVSTAAHRRGVGRLLYGAVFDHASEQGVPQVTCEVNVEPPNPVSMAFHGTLGFVEVGRQSNYGGEVVVALLSAPVDERPGPAPH